MAQLGRRKCRAPGATDHPADSLMRMRDETIKLRFILVAATATLLSVVCSGRSVYGDHVNVTGQGQKTPGKGPSNPGNPGEGDKPLLPGDQPAKQGSDSSSQKQHVDPRGVDSTKQGEPKKTP